MALIVFYPYKPLHDWAFENGIATDSEKRSFGAGDDLRRPRLRPKRRNACASVLDASGGEFANSRRPRRFESGVAASRRSAGDRRNSGARAGSNSDLARRSALAGPGRRQRNAEGRGAQAEE